MIALDAIGRSLAEGWWMFFDTAWALVLGFGLSGAVQAFVSRAEMQRALGDHTPKTLAKSSFFGVVSSSCSYAASALAKTLFARGADFTAAMVFMIASTNLVVELGIVLWLLIGWQFALAEFVGGALMIVLLALVLPRIIPASWIDAARERLNLGAATGGAQEHHGEHGSALTELSWRQRVRSRRGWSDVAGYTISDLTMLRREIAAGFIIAGFATMLVPTWVWRSVFLTGHGFWSSLENVVVGPLIAVMSFVCSVGNVPLASALWKGGISFGGVVSFVFADLITLPLLLIYRKYFGAALTVRLLAALWTTMAIAGLATEYLFRVVHLTPPTRPTLVASTHLGWNYTTILDVIAVVVFAGICLLYRSAKRDGGHDVSRFAKDPVCGMQVEKDHAPAFAEHAGDRMYFCSDRCQHRFIADPGKYAGTAHVEHPHVKLGDDVEAGATSKADPVCGMTVRPAADTPRHSYAGTEFVFCSTGCERTFARDPLTQLSVARDPVCGMDVEVNGATFDAVHDGIRYVFCCAGCRDAFRADPTGDLTTAPVPGTGTVLHQIGFGPSTSSP